MMAFAVLLVAFFYLMFKTDYLEIDGVSKKQVLIAFGFKMLAAIVLFYIYTYYYTDRSKSDIYKYFLDGEKLASISSVSFGDYLRIIFGFDPVSPYSVRILDSLDYWNKINSYGILNDNQIIIRVNSILVCFTRDSVFFSSMILSILSFLSLVFFVRSLHRFSVFENKIIFFLLFFSPTILIWTSGALKEMLMVSFLCISFGLLMKLSWRSLFLLPVSLFFLVLSKPQLGVIFVSLAILYLTTEFFKTRRIYLVYGLVTVTGMVIIALNAYFLKPAYYKNIQIDQYRKEKLISRSYEENVLGNGWNILEKLKFKQLGNRVEAKREGANSYISVTQLDGSFLNFMVVLPEGMLNAFLRPYLWEVKNIIMFVPAIENMIILIFLVISILGLFKRKNSSHDSEVWLGICYVIISSSLIGILTPVLGNLVRYKVAFLPIFYLLVVMLAADRMKFMNGLKIFKK